MGLTLHTLKLNNGLFLRLLIFQILPYLFTCGRAQLTGKYEDVNPVMPGALIAGGFWGH